MKRLAVLILVLAITGCGGDEDAPTTWPALPKTLSAARAAAEAQRIAARDARYTGDAAGAEAAGARAMAIAACAEDLLTAMDAPGDVARADAIATATTAAAAKLYGDLAAEDERLRNKLSGWKARSYRPARKAAVKAMFTSLAAAARQMGKADSANADPKLREAADLAAELATLLTGRERSADGSTDWDGVASDLDALAKNPSPKLAMMAALASLLTGQETLALYEIESVEAGSGKLYETPEAVIGLRTLRGVILSSNDFPKLAVEELESAAEGAGAESELIGPELLGSVHLLLAARHIRSGNLKQADGNIARSLRVWPNNEVAVFLTGERLAADGKTEEAAASLEKLAAGTKSEALAARIAARARAIRSGESGSLIGDPKLLRELLVHYVLTKEGRSAVARSLKRALDAAETFAARLRQYTSGAKDD